MSDLEKCLDEIISQHIEDLNSKVDKVRNSIASNIDSKNFDATTLVKAMISGSDKTNDLLFQHLSELSKDCIKNYHHWLLENYDLKPKA